MVHYGKKSCKSGRALCEALRGVYDGPDINFGFGYASEAINKPQALEKATNKRIALEIMREAGVDCPEDLGSNPQTFPCVGRSEYHSQGRGFWLCRSPQDVRRAKAGSRKKKPATHFMELILGAREFRVHVVGGESIKISEKIGSPFNHHLIRSHRFGIIFRYPYDFDHKKGLRKIAKQAVEALGLDFAAVDILYKDKFYVLECNTAPCLTDPKSDTLQRYKEAFRRKWGADEQPYEPGGFRQSLVQPIPDIYPSWNNYLYNGYTGW